MTLSRFWRSWRGTFWFLALMFVLRSALADWNYVPTSSMNPTLVAGDRVLVYKAAYSVRLPFTLVHLWRYGVPERGDVVTFDSPNDDLNLIKRVVAVENDRITMRANQLWINGEPVPREPVGVRQLNTESGPLALDIWRERIGARSWQTGRIPLANHWTDFAPVRVPPGHVLVLGDSRDNSRDSRFLGFIPVERITGRAVRVVLSHDPQRAYWPRADRWLLPLES